MVSAPVSIFRDARMLLDLNQMTAARPMMVTLRLSATAFLRFSAFLL